VTTAAVQPASPRRLVVCLDGTWNSTYNRKMRTDGHAVFKPSNVLKLARAVLPYDAEHGVDQIVNYDTGVGSLAEYPGWSNRGLASVDKTLGGGWGAGFEANIDRALSFLVLNYQPGDEVFVFGFSRGAATAQALTRFIDWSRGLPVKRDAYYLSRLFGAYLAGEAKVAREEVIAQINRERNAERRPLPPLASFQPVDIVLLGVWDTVLALGSRVLEGPRLNRSFHVGPELPACVRHARQALAVDEARSDFRPEVWRSFDAHRQTLEQRWFAGVHSNVGGGYVDDGLANLALQWMLREAAALGLVFDKSFTSKYRGYAQDRLYRSESVGYRAADAMRRRSGRGRRSLVDAASEARYTLDPSVIWRIQADPSARNAKGELTHPDLRHLYRPRNVMRFLAAQPDLASYLSSIGVAAADLPPDVAGAVDAERKKLVAPKGTGAARFTRTRPGRQLAQAVAWIKRLPPFR
jgi:uncharacterized protein (DUF2235 family)